MILLIMPRYGNVYYIRLYYIIVVFLYLPLGFYNIIRSHSIEKRFYYKWERKRKKGQLANILIEGLTSAFLMVTFVFGGQFIVDGYTPMFILSDLTIKQGISLMILVLILVL